MGTSYATQYAYDLSGKTTSVRHPDGTFVEYRYHGGSNLLWRVMSGGMVYGECTSYSPMGKIGRLSQGNGTVTRYGYDGRSGRFLSIVTTGTVGVASGVYNHDGGLNVFDVVRGFSPGGTAADPEGSDSIDGDKNPETGEEPEGAVILQKKSYRYTPSGDLMRIRDDLKGVTYDYAYDSSRPHAVRSVKNRGKTHYFSYDANGNLTYGPDLTDSSSVGWRSLSWTAENRPSEIKYKGKKTVPLTIRFEYDGEGRRTVKTVSVPTLSTGGNINPKAVSATVYVNDAFQVSNGKAVVHLFAGTVRTAEVRSGSVLYHHKDHLGNATVLTDKNGNRVETAEDLPLFGILIIAILLQQ